MSNFDSKEFMLLHEISDILSSSFNLQDSVSRIFELLNKKFGFLKAILAHSSPITSELVIKVAYGINPKEIQSKLFEHWKSITEDVLSSKETLVISELEKDSFFFGHDNDYEGSESFICFPIILGNETYGSLSVDVPFESKEKLSGIIKLFQVITLMIGQEVRLKRLRDNEKKTLRQENNKLKVELKEKYQINNMIGRSGAMHDVYDSIRQVSQTMATVIIRGESGTGKELVAHAIHYLSNRANKPFIKVNCGALPTTLIESELFGYEKGAFTDASETKIGKFEAADGGTIFLDEVSELSPQLQVKLLRVLQEKEITRVGGVYPIKVNVRVVTATNRDLEQALQSGDIREDFFYRLNVFPIILPPLRERGSDILLLADHFLEKYASENSKNIKRISQNVMDVLQGYLWPGNVRELENCIERAVIMCNSDVIQPTHLPPTLHRVDMDVISECQVATSFKDMVMNFEKKVILDALHETRGNISYAARKLSTTSRILGYKIEQLNIDVKQVKENLVNA